MRPIEGGTRYGDYRLYIDWASISARDFGITRLRLIKDWAHTDSDEIETLFDIEVPWS